MNAEAGTGRPGTSHQLDQAVEVFLARQRHIHLHTDSDIIISGIMDEKQGVDAGPFGVFLSTTTITKMTIFLEFSSMRLKLKQKCRQGTSARSKFVVLQSFLWRHNRRRNHQ